ncbi:MAG: cytosolic protein [Solirubrobacterales bacterium]|nr:cytosolic protein [Solirubrobacterales bacterium]
MSAAEATPSPRARELVRGALDLHVHVSPDVVERRIDDVGLARRCAELGLAGFALKSHYVSTAERAAVVREIVPEVTVLGAIALNRAVGGINPLAVEIAAREGALIAWMPTVDSIAERAHLARREPGANLPVWAQLEAELRERGVGVDPVRVVDDAGLPLPGTRLVLSVVAAHGLVLATGHLGRDEIFAVIDAAVAEGVREIVVTHPDYPAQDLSPAEQVELADRGALIERCFTTPHTGKCTWERWLEGIRAVGPERTLLSSDLGQVRNPPVEDGLALIADRLLAAGFDESEVRAMAVDNSRRVAGLGGP